MRISRILMMAAVAVSAVACRGTVKTPDSGFTSYIEAYTGGTIASDGDIVIVLAEPAASVEGTDSELSEMAAGLFRFSPQIKGSARWDGRRRIIFTPDEGALKPAIRYLCTFSLDKVALTDKSHRQFKFGFTTARRSASLEAGRLTVSRADRAAATVTGTLTLSEPLLTDTPENLLEFSYPEKDAEFSVSASEDGRCYAFTASGLKRGEPGSRDNVLRIRFRQGATGFDACDGLEVSVPPSGTFRVMGADIQAAEDNCLEIVFSEPLSGNMSGLVTVTAGEENVPWSKYSVADNRLRIYLDRKPLSDIEVEVFGDVKDMDGDRLGESWRKTFGSTVPLPEVSFPVEGNIFPDADHLVVPFTAVNLKAVDVRVIKIFTDNILMFLQDNSEEGIAGSNALRRAGRLVYRTTLRLDTDPSRDLSKPGTYSLDLSGMFRQEPGAIYRVWLSFTQDYYIHSPSGAGDASGSLVSTSSGQMTEEDEAVWDIPNTYYYDPNYDWSIYNWRDRKNPLTPTYYMDYDYPCRNLMCSSLGVTAKWAGPSQDGTDGRLWVAVSDIRSAEPVQGADIKVYNYQLRQIGGAKSSRSGLSEIKVSGRPFAVAVHKGGSDTYLKVTDGGEKSLSRFDTGGETVQRGLKAYVYGERGVWRPGDTLHLVMILHGDGDVPQEHPASVDIYTPQGQFYAKKICRKSENGFYTFDIATGSDSPTGLWNAYFRVGGAAFHKALRIETVKPNRLKINTKVGAFILKAGDVTDIGIASSWLTGPAASGLDAKVSMTLKAGRPAFGGFDGYVFTDPSSNFESFTSELMSARLDNAGTASTSVTLPKAENAPGMLSADLLCSVTESGGDASYASQTLPFSPFSAYVGVKLPADKDGYVETGRTYGIPVAVVDAAGKRVTGHRIEWRIFRLKWSWWWESRNEPLDSYINASGASAVVTGTAVSSQSDITVPFAVDDDDWGRYLIYVRDLDSGHASGGIVYADLPSYRGRSDRQDPDAPAMLGFSLDRKSCKVGETVTVYVPAAADGRALVSIETSSGVLSGQWVKTSATADTPYKIKVSEEMAPNFYVHITLLRPYGDAAGGLPVRMYGVQPVMVENPDSHLQPLILMPDKLHPEEPFTVKVREKNGRKMTYTLAVVDEGLLDLTAFRTPDPWSAMYRREALGVRTWDMYDNVFGAAGGAFSAMFSIGGDADLILGAKKENRFNPVVKVLGPFTLKSGTQSHRITLPMYVGSVRVMLVAGDGTAYGNAEKTVPVTSPVMILPTLPRVAGCGEKLTLPVNVFVMEDGIGSVAVSVKCEGPLKTAGPSSAEVRFDGSGDRMTGFALEADPAGSGTAKVTVTAEGGGYRMTETINVEVRNPAVAVISHREMMLRGGASAVLGFSPFKSADGEGCFLEAGGTPSVSWDGLFRYISDYPHSCTEQLSSKGLSLIYAKKMLSDANAAAADRMIPEIISELYSRQLPDGGFAYWPGNAAADEWVTSMAGEFLVAAGSAGYDVNGGVVSSWSKFQKRCVQNYRTAKTYPMSDLSQSYRLYTLAVARTPEEAAMNRLKESAGLSWQASMMLASAYAVCGKKSVGADMLGTLPEEPSEWVTDMRTYGTPLRDNAIALEAMVRTGNVTGAVAYARKVSGCGFGVRDSSAVQSAGLSVSGLQPWSMTVQESAFVSRALSLLAANAATGPIRLRIDDGKSAEEMQAPEGGVARRSVRTESGEVTVTNDSDAPVYVRLTTVSKPAPGAHVAATSSGIGLDVRYIGPSGSTMSPASISQGTEFTAVLKVTNLSRSEDLYNLSLTQMIPSGWEIVNERLVGQDVPSDGKYDWLDIRDDRNIFYFSLPRAASREFKLRLRAAYEGVFTLPSVVCEAMYDASVYARTASGSAEVTR